MISDLRDDSEDIDPVTGLKNSIARTVNFTDPTVKAPDPASTTPAPAPFATPAASAGVNDGTGRARAAAYFQSRNTTPFATSLDSWDNYWNTWGYEDPGYYDQRLSQADEFTGVGPNYDWQAAGKADPGTTAAQTAAVAAPQSVAPAQSGAFDEFLRQYQAQQAAEAANKAEVRKLLMEQLKNASAPVNETDQNIAAPLQAARDETSRSTDTERTALAERLYAQGGGLNSNALTQGIQQSSERNAGALSSLRANLITNEYNARRTQLNQLLSQALAASDADSARQIQTQIAALNAALQREGLGVNLAEFGAQLNQNAALAGLHG